MGYRPMTEEMVYQIFAAGMRDKSHQRNQAFRKDATGKRSGST